MKKILGISVLALAVMACSKTKTMEPQTAVATTSNVSTTSSHANAKIKPNGLRIFFRTLGSCSCKYDGGNCAPEDIVVKPDNANLGVITDIINTIATGTDAEIIKSFTTNYTLVCNAFYTSIVDDVISGAATAEQYSNTDTKAHYIAFTNVSTSNVDYICPVVFQ